MNALPQAEARLERMQWHHLDTVMRIETHCYAFPWTRGNFVDSLAAGYLAQVLLPHSGPMRGYFVAMPGVGEMHLLNITVAPELQGRGHARTMLDLLEQSCRENGLNRLWLEVRTSNERARNIYRQRGFEEVGLRRSYYPAPHGQREDAVVMRLQIPRQDNDELD